MGNVAHLPRVGRGRPGRRKVDAGVVVDTRLLNGFEYACRPGCALCCYATPAVAPRERERLVQLEPSLPFLEGEGGFSFLQSRAGGGACALLSKDRCRLHDARPFPCREFPITVHFGTRIQASLVLSCPGVSLVSLTEPHERTRRSRIPPGLESEWSAVAGELRRTPAIDWRRETRRSLAGLWRGLFGREPLRPDRLREEVWRRMADLDGLTYPALRLPSRSGGLEALPLFHDARWGRVALAQRGTRVEVLRLREAGGGANLISTIGPLGNPPTLSEEGKRTLRGYLQYVLARDHFLWSALAAGTRPAPVDRLAKELCEVGSTVITRAVVRERLVGHRARSLDRAAVESGIRATDLEVVDRPTVGRVL